MAVTLIAHTEVGSGGASTISFTSIAGTYDDLWLLTSLRIDSAVTDTIPRVRFNSDTGSNYSRTTLVGSGSSASSGRLTSQDNLRALTTFGTSGTSSTFSNNVLYIPNYKNSSNYKAVIDNSAAENNSSTSYTLNMNAGLWRNIAAITSIVIDHPSGLNFAQYSTATLYGITKA